MFRRSRTSMSVQFSSVWVMMSSSFVKFRYLGRVSVASVQTVQRIVSNRDRGQHYFMGHQPHQPPVFSLQFFVSSLSILQVVGCSQPSADSTWRHHNCESRQWQWPWPRAQEPKTASRTFRSGQ